MEFMEKQTEKKIAFELKTPVVFIIFNRFDAAERVFNAIAQAKPKKLFVIADGPRKNKPDEAEKCARVRSLIERVDWPCTVYKNFSDTNLGCDPRVVSGLNWVFSQTDRAIILEDDCLPEQSFFRFCDELLERYKGDERIMQISGECKTLVTLNCEESYYFTKHIEIWGWATWKRAWEKADHDMKMWQKIKKQKMLKTVLPQKSEYYYWTRLFDKRYKNEIITWDSMWAYSILKESAFSIAPAVNLVSNIGTDSKEATHGNNKSLFAAAPCTPMAFPLVHPHFVMENPLYTKYENKARAKDEKRLPYPLNKWASYAKRFLMGRVFK